MKTAELFEASSPIKLAQKWLDKQKAARTSDISKVWSHIHRAKEQGLDKHPDHKEAFKEIHKQATNYEDENFIHGLKAYRASWLKGKGKTLYIIDNIFTDLPDLSDRKEFPKTMAFVAKILSDKESVIKYFLLQTKYMDDTDEYGSSTRADIMKNINLVHRLGYHYPELDAIERSLTGKVKDRTPKPKQLNFKFEAAILDLMEQYGV